MQASSIELAALLAAAGLLVEDLMMAADSLAAIIDASAAVAAAAGRRRRLPGYATYVVERDVEGGRLSQRVPARENSPLLPAESLHNIISHHTSIIQLNNILLFP